MSAQRLFAILMTSLIIVTPILAGCGSTPVPTAALTTVSTNAPTSAPTQVPPTKAPPTATQVPTTATPQGPTVGGTVVFVLPSEPDTLDAHKSAAVSMERVIGNVGATLLTRDPVKGTYVPYLAESWKMSEDGLTWDFTLKKGVKFHDGTPLTAADYAWTFMRAIDPETKSPIAGSFLDAMASAEALDASTLRLKLKAPYFPLLLNLALAAYCSPMPKAAVEKMGDQFGRQPIGVGPYVFKAWKTGESITIERNPDFNWGPPFAQSGPYIQTIEFRIIPEYATAVNAVESGSADVYAGLLVKDVDRIKATNKVQVLDAMVAGISPMVALNVSTPPFDNLKVRKAFSLAVDRQALIKVLTLGTGVEQRGPLSPSMAGYWAGIEKLGYGYDLAQAKALMKEAGYTTGADGMLQKDGQPFKLSLMTSTSESYIKLSEMLQLQYKALGVDMDIVQSDPAAHSGAVWTGKFQIATFGIAYPEADALVIGMATNEAGGADVMQAHDAKLDKLLLATRTTMDVEKRQEAVNAAMTYIVEHAYFIPLYVTKSFLTVSNRVKGLIYSPVTNEVWLIGAYISGK